MLCKTEKLCCQKTEELTAAYVLLSDQLLHLQTALQLLVQCPPPSHLEKQHRTAKSTQNADRTAGVTMQKRASALC